MSWAMLGVKEHPKKLVPCPLESIHITGRSKENVDYLIT